MDTAMIANGGATHSGPIPLPVRNDISIRVAKASDLTFIDALQKKHSRSVGWMATVILEKRIAMGEILVAEKVAPSTASTSSGQAGSGQAIGYCMGQDRYFKRDDVGIIYQMNIEPGHQRSLVGARLLKAQFEKSAWGCKLYCCWCAQDLAANRFWEAMGFVALAFRAGSRGKRRIHIFWQKRIRSGDVTTPYWFPSQTSAGALGENRLVLPIPPGTHWSDAKPMILPEEEGGGQKALGRKELPGKRERKVKEVRPATVGGVGGLRFGAVQVGGAGAVEKKVKEPRKKTRNDPTLVAAARELRDRWLEKVNAGAAMLVGNGKYDVSRELAGDAGNVDVERVERKQITAVAA